ncbi:hypothetical protein E3T28_16160 [Cryobacterium sinapicolor]|uniref:Uncharacterized protein n=1 Tax=Cryobacterium sinapicolor TaxID=1259236 RepID=A0ABY2IUA0_9MICO|nr:hypothetical protein [Cryobacterium sinapicolor]TFC93929.1 hypothetical protein E3T28_16160 [Cryobacterium sinapicolor]
MSNEEPRWPIFLFEQDGFPVAVPTSDLLTAAYEMNRWDEVLVAFDSEGRELFLEGKPTDFSVELADDPNLEIRGASPHRVALF